MENEKREIVALDAAERVLAFGLFEENSIVRAVSGSKIGTIIK